MKIKNFEFKAKVESIDKYENLLLKLTPVSFGTDHQVDTYFNTSNGRLKLREIKGKNSSLIDYNRENFAGSKKSEIIFYEHQQDDSLKKILINQFGVKVIVDKKRKIYGIGNVRFHFDEVDNLGTFLEVEAIDTSDSLNIDELKKQCDFYYDYFKIELDQVEELSYSDLILKKQ
ncbi:CYTH domain-containing protein [Flavobacterium supellecticarium]|uniref:CYTH domain-containing protein n=1 Tax=Flavobacterium supellecticarium TaxID=2565924 RepID=A0A4S4A407_9FLAO|nr:class IV adenylate cyclase [Flavobacterium supellecticarium]THF53013.1 CYTH domain-containing protein [Flavobacterium supellecticarium]